MKNKIYTIITLLILAVYTVFSTGVLVSIHHCCSHCNPIETIDYCCCESLPAHGDPHHDCHQNESGHHKCHDTNYFFKILDSYDKDEQKTALKIVLPILYVLEDYHEIYANTITRKIVKENERSRSGPVFPGDSFFHYTHQLVLYA
ncbi:hypothetical protein LJC68_05815 [Bacteroidales bacterium OttesenSCG-928-B11]|nr:hypothetical protein [Bacteroidales bacterium OttesenSCG-928-E04]MDL2312374.1 hypothetical protein [Bacteroidales bacterium OttesenSCG-928-B11]